MFPLVSHYRELFAWMGLSALFVMGAGFGVLVSWWLLKRKAAKSYTDKLIADHKALTSRYRQALVQISALENRLVTKKVQMAEITIHLAKAIEAMK